MARYLSVAAVALLIGGCAGTPPVTSPPTVTPDVTASPAPTPEVTVAPTLQLTSEPLAEPVGLIAIGHSGLIGEGTVPGVQEARENSWATGTNPDVNSIYLRMVEAAPVHEGHVANTAVPSGTASQLAGQAREALNRVAQPALVIIQTIDGDIRCDGSDAQHVAQFGQSVTEALRVITDSSPGSRILIVSQFGRPANAAAALADDPQAVSANSGDGMCDLFDSDGQINEDAIATLTGVIEAYEAEQARVCAEFSQCTTDDGAATTFADSLDFMAADYAHFNLAGQAAQAEAIWPTVARELRLGQAAADIDGLYDVGGHSLYLKCTGTGAPTIVYFHGVIEDRATMPVSNADDIRALIDDEYRFCAYDRRNVGRSDTVDAPQRPDDVLGDVENLLAAAGVDGPYVLLGASFGGIPAYLFANRHPDDVLGMVLLDAMFPDDLTLDDLWPEEERYVTLDEHDECCELERISHYKVLVAASEYIGDEPDIPLIYLASKTEGLTVDPDAPPEYRAVAPGVLQAFVDRFSPGSLREVESPHFMEPVIPGEIADALREVITSPVAPTASPFTQSPQPTVSPTAALTGTPGTTETAGPLPDIPGTYAHSGPWLLYQAGFGFEADAPGGTDLGRMRPDGSEAHRIRGAQYERWHPYWSPDGTMIAYDRWYPADERGGLAIMGPDGSDDRWLLECTAPCLWMNYPAWSADASRVIFEGAKGTGFDDPEGDCHLGLLDVDSGDVSYMLEEVGCPFSYMTPRYSPDDEMIVFKRIDESARRSALFIAAADGSGLRQLTEWGLGARPDWSPDGEWIVFMGAEHEPPFEKAIHLYRIRPDGSQMEQLTDAPGGTVADGYPRWLPVGSGVIFSRCTGASICETRLIDPDGSNDRLLVPAFGNQVIQLMWQPPAP